jgi:pyruvate/2-oxoglutarate dehydrogenase complex dihydrolipoamide acyltransferase (E2) component
MITRIPTPRINTNDDKVEVVEWHITEGAFLNDGQEVVDLETSKAVVTVTADQAGFFRSLVKKRTVVKVGDPLYLLADNFDELFAVPQDEVGATSQAISVPTTASTFSTPIQTVRFSESRFSKAAIQLMQSRGLTATDFQGAGLVTARSIEHPRPQSIAPAQANRSSAPIPSGSVTPRSETVSLAKQAEIQTLTIGEHGNINSKLSIYFDSEPIRARLRQEQAFDGNIQPLFLYEIARLLTQWPQLTAYFEDGSVHYYDRVDLGIAFDLGKGLKVVTLQDADKLLPVNFYEKTIEIGIRYLENRIRPEELFGSTITVTDLSGFDILHFHPLINGRQSAIIGIGGDSTQPNHPMSINITFDHRVSNGREVASFLGDLRNRLNSYALVTDVTIDSEVGDDLLEEHPSLQNETPTAVFASSGCDRCAIDLVTYYREFPRDANMLAIFREDGSLGMVCHRCSGGWI